MLSRFRIARIREKSKKRTEALPEQGKLVREEVARAAHVGSKNAKSNYVNFALSLWTRNVVIRETKNRTPREVDARNEMKIQRRNCLSIVVLFPVVSSVLSWRRSSQHKTTTTRTKFFCCSQSHLIWANLHRQRHWVCAETGEFIRWIARERETKCCSSCMFPFN